MGEQDTADLAYVVIVADPVTGAVDAFGPFGADDAHADALRRRVELDAEELDDVLVTSVVLTAASYRR